jgi:hypothetical protein
MKHISIRLPWHDRGWDGCVCNNPKKNCYCNGFHSISAERIRSGKDNEAEDRIKGNPLDFAWEYYPPCSETINAFGEKPINHTFNPPEFIRNTSSKIMEMPQNSCGTWPFEGMWDRDTGKALPPDIRKQNAADFFDQVEKSGKAGLIFYYCNYDNPVSGNDKKYALAGIARIKQISPLMEWDDEPLELQKKYGNYIWSRVVENNPAERIRLPYQEYINMGKEVSDIAVFAEGDLSRSFKYGAHHVNDDDAISMIDKTIASVKTVIEQNYFDESTIGKWEKSLEWLRDIRKECWIGRGLYPGLAPVLRFLGMENPEEFIRVRLRDQPLNKIKDYFFDRFEGKEHIGVLTDKMLKNPAARYAQMMQTEEIKAKLCRDVLPYIALDDDQLRNILNDRREDYGITSSLQTIYDNPYVISEEYTGLNENDIINFEKIDHGMLPLDIDEFDNAGRIPLDDWRRLRALVCSILKNAASKGHTFLEWPEVSEKVNTWHSRNDKGNGVFNFDRTTWEQYKTDFEPKIKEDRPDGLMAIYLTKLHKAEFFLSKEFKTLIDDTDIQSAGINWTQIMKDDGKLKTEKHTDEQKKAMEKIYTARLSVLTGAAGTGKTTIIKSLINGIKQKDPHHNFLLLAPTGKASLVLRKRISDVSIPVMTIHSFLMRQNWINYSNFTLREKGKGRFQVSTIIIDECSMIDTELFYTMIKALDMGNIERLVLVGDYNQLPPIGPGKVFYDLIQYLKADDKRKDKHLAELQFNWRQEQGSKSSLLAEHYAKISSKPDEDIFSEISFGEYDISNTRNTSDLVIDYWRDEDELTRKLPDILEFAVSRINNHVKGKILAEQYDEAHGIFKDIERNIKADKRIEAIHIISPYRHTPFGVDNINICIQKILRGNDNVRRYGKDGFMFYDKILQTRNFTYSAYDHKTEKNIKDENTYIPNGTLGFVFPNKKNFQVKFPEDFGNLSYFITEKQKGEMLELGYATSVHKAQGSQFGVTITIIPNESDFLSREMLYTALTRSEKCQIVLLQNDLNLLKARLWLGDSEIAKRNSSLFSKSFGIPSGGLEKYKPENLVCEALPDLLVRSNAEVMISKALAEAEIQFYYEKLLPAKDGKSFKLPDFTFMHHRKTYYWEHKGMLDVFDYVQRDEKKDRWYKENGYQDNLIVTPREGMNLADSIEYVFKNILNIQQQII